MIEILEKFPESSETDETRLYVAHMLELWKQRLADLDISPDNIIDNTQVSTRNALNTKS